MIRPKAFMHVMEVQLVLGVLGFLLLSWPLFDANSAVGGQLVLRLFLGWAIVIAMLVLVSISSRKPDSDARVDAGGDGKRV